jgi:hypothetical protein
MLLGVYKKVLLGLEFEQQELKGSCEFVKQAL